jgi:MFS family permease
VLIVPMFAPYNQVLLMPAILALVRSEVSGEDVLPAIRRARVIGAFLLVWPWIATLGLSLVFVWITPALRERLWRVPFYSNFMLPVFLFGLALAQNWWGERGSQRYILREGAPAE